MKKLLLKFFVLTTMFLLLTQSFTYGEQRSSITQYGITWYFDGQYECGQFVTGDWWVVGPVTITHTDPLQIPGRHGSMLNVTPGTHAWDDRASGYDESLRVVFPVTINGVSSLTSTISIDASDCLYADAYPGYTSRFGFCSRTHTRTMAVLTVVNAPVPVGTFRPSYIGSNHKDFINISDADFNVLPHLPALFINADIDELISFIERPWMDHYNGWATQFNFAGDNGQGYGKTMSNQVSDMAVTLMLDVPRVEELATLMIQRAIDIYQGLQNGAYWPADGGHASGRKWPVLFAGKVLNHQGMLNIGQDYGPGTFGEDCQTFYTTTGEPWFGIRHCTEPERDGTPKDEQYRVCCTSKTWVGQMLTAMMLGLRDEWNHEAYFDYVDRWINEGGGFGGYTDYYVEELWNTYRNNLPPEIPHSGGSEPDTEAPSVPTALTASAITGSSLNLSWNASTDNITVTYYNIYIDDVLNQSVNGNLTNTSIIDLECNTTYEFKVQARDAAGNTSNMSTPLSVTTSSVCDPVNIALNKNIVVSSEDASTPGTNLVDSNTEDAARWSASGFPQWAEIDLAANYDLSQIELYTYQSRAYQYTIEAKEEDGSYTTIVDRSSNTSNSQPISDVISTTARYIKITVTGASGYTGTWVSLNELLVYDMGGSVIPVSVTGVSISPTTLTLDEGQTSDLTETVSPTDATNKSVTWTSNNTSIVTVNTSGLVTAIAEGNATITVTTNDGGYTANCAVTVNTSTIPVTGVSLVPSTLTLDEGQTSDLTETVIPSNATDKSVTWSSNNTSVATVNGSGLVTAIAEGNATITVTTNDDSYTANCAVTVNATGGSALPSPWASNDIGNVAATGSATYSTGTFTVQGSGSNIYGTADEFQFVYQQISGDAVITAQITSLAQVHQWTKGGVMMRETLDANSINGHTFLAPVASNGSKFSYRTTTGATTSEFDGPDVTASYWLRMERSGNTFTGSVSVDGTTWTTLGFNTINMASTYYIGLCVSSLIDGTLATGTFDNVSITTTSTVPVTGISVLPTTLTLDEGQTSNLTETVNPSNATDQSVTWSSNNTSVATINANGLVTAISSGNATITVTTVDGGYTATCNVTVNVPVIPVTDVSISASTLTLEEGQTDDLDETVSPVNATDKSVTWSSNNTSVATVDANGLVTAMAEGSATITVTTNDGGHTATCAVTINSISVETNLALNKPITVSAYQDDSFGYKPGENLVDGDVSDDARWSASGFPQWAEIDLGANYDLNQIDLYPYQDRAYQYIVEAKPDGGSYTTIVDKSANTESADLLVSPVSVTARYVKITVSGLYGNSSTWVSLSELEVWGTAPSIIPVTGVTLSSASLTLDEGQTADIDETVSPVNATDKTVTWSSNNTSVATINSSGLVTAISAGNATITVTTIDGGYTATCGVTVNVPVVPVTGVTLSSASLTLDEGQTSDLTETVNPVDATDKSVTWSSNNTSVATVDVNGLVTAISAGNATITVITNDGSYTANCDITVISSSYITGSITREYWTGISGNFIPDLTGNANYPDNPTGNDVLTSLEATDWNNSSVTSNWADNYGERIRGYLIPEATGDYTFWIASDNCSDLYISSDDNPANITRIAYVEGSTPQYDWDKYSSQKSVTVSLVAGEAYYIEILHKDGCCGDNLAVGWAKPGEGTSAPSEIIPGNVLAPFNISANSIISSNNITSANNIADVNLYPNPLSGNILNIKVNGYDEANVIIYDIMGKTVYNQSHNMVKRSELQIPLGNLNKGVYIISVNGKQQKLIVE